MANNPDIDFRTSYAAQMQDEDTAASQPMMYAPVFPQEQLMARMPCPRMPQNTRFFGQGPVMPQNRRVFSQSLAAPMMHDTMAPVMQQPMMNQAMLSVPVPQQQACMIPQAVLPNPSAQQDLQLPGDVKLIETSEATRVLSPKEPTHMSAEVRDFMAADAGKLVLLEERIKVIEKTFKNNAGDLIITKNNLMDVHEDNAETRKRKAQSSSARLNKLEVALQKTNEEIESTKNAIEKCQDQYEQTRNMISEFLCAVREINEKMK